MSVLYEFFQPVWNPTTDYQVRLSSGPIVTYVPEWVETNVGIGGSLAVLKLTALQTVVDGTVVSTILPRLLVSGVGGVEVCTDKLVNGDGVHWRAVLGVSVPLN